MYRTSSRFPPVYLFFFGVQNRFFFCGAKEKVVLAPAGQAKNQLQDKTHHFPTKEKTVLPAPSVRRHSTHRVRAVSKRHSRQETACHQQPGGGPSRASGKTIPSRAGRNQQNRKGVPFRRRKKQICEVPLPGGYDIRPYKCTVVGRKAFTRKGHSPSVRQQSTCFLLSLVSYL